MGRSKKLFLNSGLALRSLKSTSVTSRKPKDILKGVLRGIFREMLRKVLKGYLGKYLGRCLGVFRGVIVTYKLSVFNTKFIKIYEN